MMVVEIRPEFREALAACDILCAYGIAPDDVYVEEADGCFYVVARQGELCFRVYIASLGVPVGEEFRREWVDTVETYNTLSQSAREAIVDSTSIRNYGSQIGAGLVIKGFTTCCGAQVSAGRN